MADEGLFGGGAAFGVFPQMGGRRRLQDPQASADVPFQGFRGSVAGLLGLLPDVANFMGRSPMPTETFGEFDYGPRQQLPYGSEFYLKELPLAPTSPVGQLAGQVGSFVPLSPMPAVRGAQTVGRMVGQRMAENVAMGRPSLPSMLAEPRSSLFAVEPSAMMPKPQAQVSELGFYSAAEQAAMNLARNKGTGQSFLNDLMKAPDVKKDELVWTGLDDFLANKPNVTKQEVQDYLSGNRVDVQEVRLGEPFTEDPVGVSKRLAIFDRYEPEIQALYKEMDNPRYRLVNRGMSAEEYNRGVVLQNRGFRGEPLTVQEQSELDGILQRLDGNTVKEFANAEEARKVYLAMSPEEKLQHSIRPVKSSTELQQEINTIQRTRDIEADRAYVIPEPAPAKYSKYQLPGGENYREILMTLPSSKTSMEEFLNVAGKKYGGNTPRNQWSPEDNAMYEKLLQEERTPTQAEYRSSHFSEPNILAHIRVNDRVDADGKKMLLIEEIQSDWHQAGREKGYNTPEKRATEQKKLDDLLTERQQLLERQKQLEDLASPYTSQGKDAPSNILDEWNSVSNRINRLQTEQNRLGRNFGDTGVPDAPFKDTWYQLALKRVLKHAADNGYERVGLTTGKQQAQRFDLSKQVDEITVPMVNEDGTRSVRIDPTEGTSIKLMVDAKGVVTGYGGGSTQFSGKKLSEVIGKDIADKVMQANANAKFTGLDLSVGGEGMKKYYDEIYPKFLDKYGKKWNAKIGETQISTGDNAWNMAEQIKMRGISDAQWRAMSEADKLTLWNEIKKSEGKTQESIRYIDITPEMKGAVSKGQPLFAAAPVGSIGLGYQKDKADNLEETSPTYTDPFGNTIGSSIR